MIGSAGFKSGKLSARHAKQYDILLALKRSPFGTVYPDLSFVTVGKGLTYGEIVTQFLRKTSKSR